MQCTKQQAADFVFYKYSLSFRNKLKRIYIPFGRKKYCVFDKVIKKEIQFIERIVLRKSFWDLNTVIYSRARIARVSLMPDRLFFIQIK